MTQTADQADAGASPDSAETVTILRADYETLRAVAASALTASATLSGIARLQTTLDGEGFEIAVSDDVQAAIERAETVLGPLLPDVLVNVAGADQTAEVAA